MSASKKPTAKPRRHSLVPASVKRAWSASKPVRTAMGLVFVLHGWIMLGADLGARRTPFFLADIADWSAWLSDRWIDGQAWWDSFWSWHQ